jgi:hypothetical protein
LSSCEFLISIIVIDLALDDMLFNAISPVIKSAKTNRVFLVVLVDSLVIDLVSKITSYLINRNK